MATKTKLAQALTIVLLLSVREILPLPPPAVGDIRLVQYKDDSNLKNHYEVHVYYTDGRSGGSYGGVCADDTYETEAKVICHQLGYQYISFRSGPISNSPVWLTHIDCDNSNISHILRCKVTVASETERNVNTCPPNNYRLLVNCDFNQPLPTYDGQVTLCPVNNDSSIRVSTSYGLVGIFYEKYQAREGINQNDEYPLGGIEADTICRNLGFTGADPWSAESRAVANYNFSECFSNTGTRPPYKLNHGAWVTTDDVNCDGTQKCIGCCMKYPSRASCDGCDDQKNIVIRCVFDPSKILPNDVTANRAKDCKLNENKNVGQCAQDNTQQLIRDLRISLGFIVVFLILLGPCGIVCLCYSGYKGGLHQRCMQCLRCRQNDGHVPIVDHQDNGN